MKKIVLWIVIIAAFSYFVFPIFWGANREEVNAQFIYDEFVHMSEMDPFDFLATKVATPALAYISEFGNRAMYYVNLGVGTVLYGSDFGEALGSYSQYSELTGSLSTLLDDLDMGIFQGSLFDKIGDLFNRIFGGNE